MIAPDGYFLSATNPLATADQRDAEALALRLIETPAVRQMRAKVEAWFRIAAGRDMTPELEATLPNFIDNYVFHYALIAANSDPEHPRVTQAFAPAHEWFGMRVPGSQFGDNPDNCYRIVPVSGDGRYEVKARRVDAGLDVSYTLIRGTALTHGIATLEERDLVPDEDGSGGYTLTLDVSPAEGRPNHLQLRSDAAFQYLYVRDTRTDWRQAPNLLTVRKLDAPAAPPRSFEQLARFAADIMIDDMPITHWFGRCLLAPPPNVLAPPRPPGPSGGLFVQLQSNGSIALDDGEAMVVTLNTSGAAYHNVVVCDGWFVPRDIWRRPSSLNNAQSVPNADGSYTYVISPEDPGVHNWIDTGGLRRVLFLNRNQGLPREVLARGGGIALSHARVKLDDLPRHLPEGTRFVDPEERRQQLARRAAELRLRFVDS